MIAGLAMQDQTILSIGAAIESVLAANGRAIHTLPVLVPRLLRKRFAL